MHYKFDKIKLNSLNNSIQFYIKCSTIICENISGIVILYKLNSKRRDV